MPQLNGSLTLGSYLDLATHELRNFQVQNLASDPGTAVLGQEYYNTTSNKLRVCTNATGPVFADVGAGAGGDASTNTATSVDSEAVIFSGTTGKIVKRSALTGVIKQTAGVQSVATAGTDYYNPGGTDVAVADGGTGVSTLTGIVKGNGASAFTAAAAGTDYLAPAGSGAALTGITESQITSLVSDLAAKAPTASPTFTGTVLLPATGAGASEAATKSYVDGISAGVFYKASVKAASTANVALTTGLVAGQAIDGITLATGDRVLLKNQTNHQDDGIYLAVASGTGTRATDMDTAAEAAAGATVFVDTGTVNSNTMWTQTATIVTLGTTVMAWVKIFQSPDLTGQSIPRMYAALCGDGSTGTTSGNKLVITHNLGLADRDAFTWSLILRSTHVVEQCEVTSIDTNSIGLWGWPAAPASNAYFVSVVG